MSKQDKQSATALNAPPQAAGSEALRSASIGSAPPAPVRETWVRLRRDDYLTSAVEVLTLEDGIEVGRKTVHPPDIARIALDKGYTELERMVEDR
jgi:hypothetical protein